MVWLTNKGGKRGRERGRGEYTNLEQCQPQHPLRVRVRVADWVGVTGGVGVGVGVRGRVRVRNRVKGRRS